MIAIRPSGSNHPTATEMPRGCAEAIPFRPLVHLAIAVGCACQGAWGRPPPPSLGGCRVTDLWRRLACITQRCRTGTTNGAHPYRFLAIPAAGAGRHVMGLRRSNARRTDKRAPDRAPSTARRVLRPVLTSSLYDQMLAVARCKSRGKHDPASMLAQLFADRWAGRVPSFITRRSHLLAVVTNQLSFVRRQKTRDEDRARRGPRLYADNCQHTHSRARPVLDEAMQQRLESLRASVPDRVGIFELWCRGKTKKQIAAAYGLTENKVKNKVLFVLAQLKRDSSHGGDR